MSQPMRQQGAAAAIWACVIALALAGVAVNVLAWRYLVTGDAASNLGDLPAAVLYATLGALVVRRAGNLVGWILLFGGIASAIVSASSAYAVLGSQHPGTLPGVPAAGLLAVVSFVLLIFGIAYMLLLFPTGHLPSRRWRPAAAAAIALTAVSVAEVMVHPGPIGLPAPGGVSARVMNPLGPRSLPAPLTLAGSTNALWGVLLIPLAMSFVALVVRYRSGDRELRQQIKWIAFTAGALVASALVVLAGMRIGGQAAAVLYIAGDTVATIVGLAGFPIAIAVAILKYGLYQIDVILSRAVSYGLLSAALTAIYVSIVVGIGTLAGYAGGPVLTVAAAVVVAVLFHPVRQRATRVANRLVYGERKSPYQVLADFAGDMAGQLDPGTALDRMTAVLAGATGAERVEVWVLVESEPRPAAIWPAGAEPGPAPAAGGPGPLSRTVGVYHHGEQLGVITLAKARNEPVSAADDKLLADLASQAGLVLRNARLTAELQATIDDLRASRRRLVRAQDEERQRIERNLHDGAQQQLVALSVQLAILETAAGDPAEVTELAGELREMVRAAVDELRALARGIYPPLLADQGLAAALSSQAGRAAIPVVVDADGLGRYPREVEAAVYFCVLEALQNTAKHAAASCATVILRADSGQLRFSVADDGAGFDRGAGIAGTGMQGMADRLAAAGGTLLVSSAPGAGTTVSGTVPLAGAGRPAGRLAGRPGWSLGPRVPAEPADAYDRAG